MRREDLVCEEESVHSHSVEGARVRMPDGEHICALANFYKAFADGTRLRILYALSLQELCVCDIAELLGTTISAVSHQLRYLRDLDLVRFRREGKTVFYSLADSHVQDIISCGTEHLSEGD